MSSDDDAIVSAMQLLAETEGIWAETAGGVTVAVAQKLIEQGRIDRDGSTVLCGRSRATAWKTRAKRLIDRIARAGGHQAEKASPTFEALVAAHVHPERHTNSPELVAAGA